jgi:hypothetical protein
MRIFVTAGVASVLLMGAAFAVENGALDLADIHPDRQEIRRDHAGSKLDRADLRRDLRDLRADRRESAEDRFELRRDHREARSEHRDCTGDRRHRK